MSARFTGIDLTEHVTRLERAADGAWRAVIWSGNAVRAASQPDEAQGIANRVIAAGVSLPPDRVREIDIGENCVRIHPVHDHLGNPLAAILVYGNGGAFREAELRLLDVLVDTFAREARLGIELEEMASELNRRHEELNLIYGTSSPEEAQDDEDDQLAQTVRQMLEHMEGDLAMLSVPARNIRIISAPANHPAVEEKSVPPEVESAALEWIARHGKALVINQPGESIEELAEIWSMRSLFVPISDEQGRILGSLGLFRSAERPRFVNSDKNLVLVIAERLGKTIQAAFDSLTGLSRRHRFERLLERAIRQLGPGTRKHALLYVDIDGLGVINGQHGMRAGDQALELVATQLRATGRTNDICGRVGGDEFVLLLLDCPEEVAARKARELQERLVRQNFMVGKARLILRISVGVLAVPREFGAVEAMWKASEACAIAKDGGGNVVESYGRALHKVTRKNQEVRALAQIRQAIEDDRFELFAQEIAPVCSESRSPHFEVLLRFRDEDGQLVPPVEFIPVAEKYNLMPAIDRWVVHNAIRELHTSGILQRFPGTVCSINLSGQSFAAGSVLEDLEGIIRQQNVPAGNLCFEVTETAAIADLASARYHIGRIRSAGCRFALDDFGAGLSSFSYLRSLPLDYVKIDGSFVRDVCNDETARVMVTAIHNVGHSMNLETVAEYVEDDRILEALRAIGVDYGQGYGIARPVNIRGYLQGWFEEEVRRHG